MASLFLVGPQQHVQDLDPLRVLIRAKTMGSSEASLAYPNFPLSLLSLDLG